LLGSSLKISLYVIFDEKCKRNILRYKRLVGCPIVKILCDLRRYLGSGHPVRCFCTQVQRLQPQASCTPIVHICTNRKNKFHPFSSKFNTTFSTTLWNSLQKNYCIIKHTVHTLCVWIRYEKSTVPSFGSHSRQDS
jgi:hypothetical protein